VIGSEDEARDWIAARPEGNPLALERLERLAALLADENTRQNLVSAASLPQTWQRHFADSAQLLAHVPVETEGPWLDLGTGAGFPGLVIALLRPERETVMIESRARRVEWLNRAIAALDLRHTRVIGKRLELVESFPAAVISARAFAPLDRLLDISARFSTSDTIWLLPKGRSAQDEVNRLSGWNHLFHVEQSLTDSEAGVVVGTLTGRAARKARTA